MHLVVSKKSRNTVPIWLHEGLAKYLESRWRGPPGGAMTPSSLALLGKRVRANDLVPFEKMHPSMALLPSAEDAATAFSEVFFAVKLIDTEGGRGALERVLDAMAKGTSEKLAIEQVMKKRWPEFERAWMAYLKKQPFPKDLIPPTSHERKQLTDGKPEKKSKGREVSFGDFKEVKETDARRDAHLGELFRERNRMASAAEVYGRAYKVVGDKYESVSNKYALTLLELKRFDEAAKVLEASLVMHPGSVSTNVHLGRIYVRGKKWDDAKRAYLEALNVNPFDPEVMVGLLASADVMKDAELRTRALAGAKVLLETDEATALKAAREYARTEDLAFVDLGGGDAGQ